MKPNRAGTKMCFQLQSQGRAGWHTEFLACYRIERSGKSTIYVIDVPLGAVARIRASYRRTLGLLGDKSRWSYLRVVR